MEFRKDADGMVSCSAFPGEKFEQVVSCTGYSGSKSLFPYCLSAVTPITDLHVHNAWMTGQCDFVGAGEVVCSWRLLRDGVRASRRVRTGLEWHDGKSLALPKTR